MGTHKRGTEPHWLFGGKGLERTLHSHTSSHGLLPSSRNFSCPLTGHKRPWSMRGVGVGGIGEAEKEIVSSVRCANSRAQACERRPTHLGQAPFLVSRTVIQET